MIDNVLNVFEKMCRKVLEKPLLDYGYRYRTSYHRSRGIVLEFTSGDNRCFISCEGDVVVMDIILSFPVKYYRVSVNQALWFNGVRDLTKTESVADQLTLIAKHLQTCCGEFLSGSHLPLDSRYSFKMSEADASDYIRFQTGE